MITQELKKNSLRITQARLAVAKVLLRNSNLFFTSEEIFQKVLKSKKVSCDQVSVYRILSKFEELGLVKKSEFNNEATRYTINEAFGHGHKHEHFFKCVQCYTIESFSDCFISKKEKELESNGYRKLTHHLEITGLCPTCAA